MCVYDNHLPQVAHNGGISPGMLSIQTHCAILKYDQVKGLVKPSGGEKKLHLAFHLHMQHSLQIWVYVPTLRQITSLQLLDGNLVISWPVVAFSMKQRFSIAVKGLHRVIRLVTLLCVVQRDKESSLLHCVQRLLVLPPAEKLSTGLRPRDSAW